MSKWKHPDGTTVETRPAYEAMYESQGYEKVTTPTKKSTATKAETDQPSGDK